MRSTTRRWINQVAIISDLSTDGARLGRLADAILALKALNARPRGPSCEELAAEVDARCQYKGPR